MKKTLSILFLAIALVFALGIEKVSAQKMSIIDSLNTIDPELRKIFPRWKVCEPDLQFQIYQAFVLLGYNKNNLNMQSVEVLSAPRSFRDRYYDILLITCGEESMNARMIDDQIKTLSDYLSGKKIYDRRKFGDRSAQGERTYCFVDIPPEIPVNNDQAIAIQDYLEPTDVTQAFSISLFEQSLKLGESGFWVKNIYGNDQVGYPFWAAGEAKVILKRPLYTNLNSNTRESFPYLINAYLGGGYRITSGINEDGGILSWLPERKLNNGPGGKLIAGLDVNMPFHPQSGVHFNIEIPFQSIDQDKIEVSKYAMMPAPFSAGIPINDPRYETDSVEAVAPILGTTGQFTFFYHWWINREDNPENYFRFDLGVSYAEVQNYAVIFHDDTTEGVFHHYLDKKGIPGLRFYHPKEFGDWVFAKMEYRNQAAFPFGVSVQYSNQLLLARAYMPLIGNWFLLEGKYAQPLRSARPYETEHFFVISPILRITI